MNAETDKLERTFLAKWILVTSGACILALPATFILATICPPFRGGENLTIAAIVGCAQWSMLRKRFAISGWWVLACAMGVGLPFVIGAILEGAGVLPDLSGGSHGKILGVAIIGIVGGLLSGLLQIRLLRSHFTRAGRWVLASALGWGICWVGILFNPFLVGCQALADSTMGGSPVVAAVVTGLAAMVGGIMGPVLLGVVTGIALLWMPRLPVPRIA